MDIHYGVALRSSIHVSTELVCALQHTLTPTPPGHRDVPGTSFTSKLQYIEYTDNTEKKRLK